MQVFKKNEIYGNELTYFLKLKDKRNFGVSKRIECRYYFVNFLARYVSIGVGICVF